MAPEQWPTEAQAVQEAKRRNNAEAFRAADYFWIETELPSGDWAVERRKAETPAWRKILGGLAVIVGMYLFLWLGVAFGVGPPSVAHYHEGDCIDTDGNPLTCRSSGAASRLVREAESSARCRGAYYEEDWPWFLPWIPEDGYCARFLR